MQAMAHTLPAPPQPEFRDCVLQFAPSFTTQAVVDPMNIRLRGIRPLLCASLLVPGLALAQHDDENVMYAFADVLSAEPWYETVETVRPSEQCYDTHIRRERGNTGSGALVGAVIGGVAGSNVGSGSGRRAATVAGAVIGGLIGNEAEKDRRSSSRRVERVTECEVVDEVTTEQHIAGYEVQYRYRGEIFVSRLSYDPGSKLRVRVAVSPADP